MITLKHAATGHEIKVDEESLDFWTAAGFRETADKPPRKSAAKKAAAKPSK